MTERIAEIFGHPASKYLMQQPSEEILHNYHVGLEFEVEGVRQSSSQLQLNEDISLYFDLIDDSSLRSVDDLPYYEFVFFQPLFGEDLVRAVDAYCAVTAGAVFSERTSVHVHLDVRDMSYTQLLKLVCFYLYLEPIFFEVGGEERKHNPYCPPLRGIPRYLASISNILSKSTPTPYSVIADSGNKYTALNLNPVATQGSVEFRHMKGTRDSVLVKNWVNAIMCLKWLATSDDDPISMEDLERVADNYVDLVGKVFGHMFNRQEILNLAGRHMKGAGLVAKKMLHSRPEAKDKEELDLNSLSCPFYSLFPEDQREQMKVLIERYTSSRGESKMYAYKGFLRGEDMMPQYPEAVAVETSSYDPTPILPSYPPPHSFLGYSGSLASFESGSGRRVVVDILAPLEECVRTPSGIRYENLSDGDKTRLRDVLEYVNLIIETEGEEW